MNYSSLKPGWYKVKWDSLSAQINTNEAIIKIDNLDSLHEDKAIYKITNSLNLPKNTILFIIYSTDIIKPLTPKELKQEKLIYL